MTRQCMLAPALLDAPVGLFYALNFNSKVYNFHLERDD